MEEGNFFCYNGKNFTAGKAIVSADNRSFKYGDGFFETMKMVNGKIGLEDYHFERLFSSLHALKFQQPGFFTAHYLSEQINKTIKKNNHAECAVIRLNIFRGNGGLYNYENDFPNYTIQTFKLNPGISKLNKNGYEIDIYTKARKSCDDFSHIKSNNYLCYAMAAQWAKENKLDDAIILNNYNRIADASIANVFLIKDGKIKTPGLTEGCIGGVKRKFILQILKNQNISFEEAAITPSELSEANEIFLTNAVRGIKWVKRCGHYHYKKEFISYLYNEMFKHSNV